jgi:hypothetical protein
LYSLYKLLYLFDKMGNTFIKYNMGKSHSGFSIREKIEIEKINDYNIWLRKQKHTTSYNRLCGLASGYVLG